MYPFNPRRVLDKIPKPVNQSTPSVSDGAESGLGAHDEVPQTPVTPVSAQALTVLLDKIEQIPDTESHRKVKEKLQQKHAKATRLCIAELSMLQIRNDALTQINNEGKVRRSAKPNIVGRARIMAWDDIEAARSEIAAKAKEKEEKKARREAKNAEKEAMKAASKSTPGRKRKTSPVAADVPESSNKSPRMDEASDPWEFQRVWVGEEQQIAPVARMI